MKDFFSILFFSLFWVSGVCQDFIWVDHIKGINYENSDFAYSMDVDQNGNTYTVGVTNSHEFDLDPTSGTDIISTPNSFSLEMVYLIKTDANGNYIWGKTFGSIKDNDTPFKVILGNDGNIHLFMQLEEEVSNSIEMLLNILTIAPDGTVLQTKKIKRTWPSGFLYTHSFAIDSQNNIYCTGFFNGTIQLETGNPASVVTSPTFQSLLYKINSDGSFAWLKVIESLGNGGEKVLVRPDGNLTLLTATQTGYSVQNINSATSALIWKKDFANGGATNIYHLNNSIVITGGPHNSDTMDVDPSAVVNNLVAFQHIIFLGMNGDFVDAKGFNFTDKFYFTAATDDVDNNFVFAGVFNGSADFDPSPSNYTISTITYDTIAFYLSLDSNRNFSSAYKIGECEPYIPPHNTCYLFRINDLKVRNNESYLIGDFAWNCDFDPSPTTSHVLGTVINATINADAYILKLGNCTMNAPTGTASQTFCSEQNPTIANLTPNSTSIRWYSTPTAGAQLSATTPLIDGQTYYASRKAGNCPESIQRLPVTASIIATPGLPTAAPQVFCESDQMTLADIAITGQAIKWYSSMSSTPNLTSSTVLTNNTAYFASQTVNGCESQRIPVPVSVIFTAAPQAPLSQSFCMQQNATLNDIVIVGANIKWYPDSVSSLPLVLSTPLISGSTYYASQTSNGCESTRIAVNCTIQNTNVPSAQSPQIFCSVQNPTLSDVAISGSTILWYATPTSTVVISPNTLMSDGTTYFASQTVNNCESPSRIPVAITIINMLKGSNFVQTLCDDLDDGVEVVDLRNYNANLISLPGGYNFEYYTSFPNANTQMGALSVNEYENYDLGIGNSTVYVRIISPNGCYVIVSLELILVRKPELTIPQTIPMCNGDNPTIDAGSGFNSYLWSTGETTQSIRATTAGSYSVTVSQLTNGVNCQTSQNFSVVFSEAAVIKDIEASDWTDFDNSISVDVTGNGKYSYSIDGINYQYSKVFNNLPSGYYTVYVKDDYGCGISNKDVLLLMYPKFFTPNGDGHNDTWSIKFSSLEPGTQVTLFDRYGKIIKKLTTYNWDGTSNGQPLPPTDYWFLIARPNGKEYRGHFTLKR